MMGQSKTSGIQNTLPSFFHSQENVKKTNAKAFLKRNISGDKHALGSSKGSPSKGLPPIYSNKKKAQAE